MALSEVAELTVGHVGPMATEYVRVGVPFLRSQNVLPMRLDLDDVKFVSRGFHEKLSKSTLRPGDVVIVRTGRPGACAVIPGDMVEANCADLVVIRCGPRLDPRFLSYYVNALAGAHVSAYTVGAVQQHFNVGAAKVMRVPLPPLPEQRHIAGILGALDDKIELNRRMSETLEATARATFTGWFIDESREGGVGPAVLGEIAEIVRSAVDPQSLPNTSFAHFSIPAFDAGRQAQLEMGSSIKSVKTAVPPGSVLLSKLNPEIERVWLTDVQTGDRAICSTEFLVLRPRAPFGRAFLYGLMRSTPFRREIEALVTGTSRSHQRAHADAVLRIPVALAVPQQAARYETVVGPLFDRVSALSRESVVVRLIRDGLLPKLIAEGLPLLSDRQGATGVRS